MVQFISRVTLFIIIIATATHKLPAQSNAIIPQPLKVEAATGVFQLTAAIPIVVRGSDPSVRFAANALNTYLKQLSGHTLKIITGETKQQNAIVLSTGLSADSLGNEGYELRVDRQQILIQGNDAAGVFYGVQTLCQLMNGQNSQKDIRINCVTVTDRPRFGWRGMMLDVGRYFYPVDFIKKYIDYLAMHKLNTFHWHLTEDHGWRIEIKKYPRLTETGAARSGTQFGLSQRQVSSSPHWGFYTQEQVKDIVQYAKERFITVVPEIEMPGHSLAALAAYPDVSCTGGPFKMPVQWGIQKDIYCAGNEQTFSLLEGILDEVCELFPSKIIHIGGDEAPKDRWKECPKCQARIKQEKLKDEHELQSYFITRIENYLVKKDRRIIGWDEILEGGLAPNAAVMSWRGIKGGIEAAKLRHDVVMSPTDFMYLDYYQGDPQTEPVAIGGWLPLEKVYGYEPVPAELSREEAKFIKGVQGNVWCEFIHSQDKVEYMAFPRGAALAEVAWSDPGHKDWNDFLRRMEVQYSRYDKAGLHYAKTARNVQYATQIDTAKNSATVTLKTESYAHEIRYTTDGTEPVSNSSRYIKPITLAMPVTIKAASFRAGKKLGITTERSLVLPR